MLRRARSNAGAGRRVRSRGARTTRAKGKRGQRAYRKKARTVKRVSMDKLGKMVKEKVKKTLMCKENTGTYTRYYTGEVEPFVNAGQDRLVIGMTRNQANAPPYGVFDMIFNPFSRRRWLDAVSVLYGGKAKGVNAISNTVNNFPLAGFKLETIYASYNLKVWNYTQYPYEIEFFKSTSKHNSDTYPLVQVAQDLLQDDWVGGFPTFTLAGSTQFDIDKTFDLSMVKSAAAKFDIQRLKKGVIFPGAAMNVFVKDKAKCIDFTKQLTPGSALPYYAKGDQVIFFRISPVTHLYASSTNHITTNVATSTSVNHGFLIEVQEKFRLFEPPETDETRCGDKRAFMNDTPVTPDGIGPLVQKFVSTGPMYTDIINPGV